ncbi:hypothetical protein BCR42DRAFT_300628, partial [Absidia repens]
PPKSWSRFWKLRLTPSARNTWFRLIHHKWPDLTRLHYFMPHQFPSTQCQYCLAPLQDTKHLALLCPSRAEVWSTVWTTVIPNHDLDLDSLWIALLHLRPPPASFNVPLSFWHQFLGITLHAIWTAHWNKIFHNVPFSP